MSKIGLLFLTIFRFQDIEKRRIYSDLMRKFRDEEHEVYMVTPLERKYHQKTSLEYKNGIHILGVQTLNLQKINIPGKVMRIISVE
mgnify:CR=1 FL=1